MTYDTLAAIVSIYIGMKILISVLSVGVIFWIDDLPTVHIGYVFLLYVTCNFYKFFTLNFLLLLFSTYKINKLLSRRLFLTANILFT